MKLLTVIFGSLCLTITLFTSCNNDGDYLESNLETETSNIPRLRSNTEIFVPLPVDRVNGIK